MFVLLIIVVLAILALWMSHQERKRPAALFMMGLLCVILGGRAVAVLSNSYSDAYWGAVYGDEDSPPGTVPASDGDCGDTVESTSKSAEAVASHKDIAPVSANARPHELTIEPTPSFRYLTMPRPEWVETEVTKSDEFYQVPVESGLHFRKLTAQKSLRDEVKAAVDKYVNDYLESELASSLAGYSIEVNETGATRTISLRLEGEIYEIAHERFDEQVEFDYGVMNQSHALVKLDKQLQAALDQRWSKVRATSRLFQMGLGAAAVLLLLGTMFSYLKLDTATRGYYTGRLQFGAAAAILAVIAAGVVFANWIPWM